MPEVGTVPPEDDLYGDNADDIDDGHIPPDLYGEPEPDEEVAETAYDYKNDYDQAQDSNSEQAGGLSWYVGHRYFYQVDFSGVYILYRLLYYLVLKLRHQHQSNFLFFHS